jgi:virginiamycin B lyase
VRGVAVKLVVASLVALLVAGSAVAAPSLRARVRAPASATVGEEWRAQISVTRGSRAVSGLRVTVRVRHSSVTRTRRARGLGRGRYAARLTFPRAGRWTYVVVAAGRALARGSVTVRARAASGPTPTPPLAPTCTPAGASHARFQEWCVARLRQVHPHDVWPAADGTIWYTGQFNQTMGRLDPATGSAREIPLPPGASPHGVIVGPDGAAWVTDQGLNAIVRVGSTPPETVTVFPIPVPNAQPNTATFDHAGDLWFTGNSGWYGRVDLPSGAVEAWPAPRGAGPYGIHTTPSGDVYFVSLRGPDDYLGRIDGPGAVTVIETPGSGARRVWSDAQGRLWVTEFNSGHLARYDPANGSWKEWALPGGANSQPYAVCVDRTGSVWVTSFGANALVRFDPTSEMFESFPFPTPGAAVRQIVADPRGVWGAESGTEKIVLFRST